MSTIGASSVNSNGVPCETDNTRHKIISSFHPPPGARRKKGCEHTNKNYAHSTLNIVESSYCYSNSIKVNRPIFVRRTNDKTSGRSTFIVCAPPSSANLLNLLPSSPSFLFGTHSVHEEPLTLPAVHSGRIPPVLVNYYCELLCALVVVVVLKFERLSAEKESPQLCLMCYFFTVTMAINT